MRYFKYVSIFSLVTILISGSVPIPQAKAIEPNQELTTATAELHIPVEAVTAVEVTPPREKLLEAALSQLGTFQDCTDLVQNSLAVLGLTTRRDQGGYDFGVQELGRFGTPIPASEAQPGDIAIIGPDNGGHIWIVLDPATSTGVHGGVYEGGRSSTVIINNGVPLGAHTVYRLEG